MEGTAGGSTSSPSQSPGPRVGDRVQGAWNAARTLNETMFASYGIHFVFAFHLIFTSVYIKMMEYQSIQWDALLHSLLLIGLMLAIHGRADPIRARDMLILCVLLELTSLTVEIITLVRLLLDGIRYRWAGLVYLVINGLFRINAAFHMTRYVYSAHQPVLRFENASD